MINIYSNKDKKLKIEHSSIIIYDDSELNNNNNNKFISPATLESISLEYISINAHHIDSLQHVPELIGSKIFQQILTNHRRHPALFLSINSDWTRELLSKFNDVYGCIVLEELTVFGKWLQFENCFESLQAFKNLRKMDLSNCRFGDGHPIIDHIARLFGLTHLYLQNNSISQECLRKLTTILCVYKCGLTLLTHFDISDNPLIDQKSVRYLKRFPKLKAINLTNTSLKADDVQTLCVQFNLHISTAILKEKEEEGEKKRLCSPLWSVRENKGWAKDLVSKWLSMNEKENVSDSTNSRGKNISKTKIDYGNDCPSKKINRSFYSNKRNSLINEKNYLSSINKNNPLYLLHSDILTEYKIF